MSKQVLHFFFDLTAYSPRIKYILDFLEQHPLCPEGVCFKKNGVLEKGEIGIYYGIEKRGNGFYIPTQRIAFNEKLPVFSQLQPGKYRSNAMVLSSVEESPSKKDSIFCQNKQFGFDLIETIFFHITRMEEHHCTPDQLDQWDMMKSSEQFLSKYGLEQQPVVDHLVYCFFKELVLKVKDQQTGYGMSHDIDLIQKFKSPGKVIRSMGSALYRGWGFSAVGNIYKTFRAVKRGEDLDPFDTFAWLLINTKIPKVMYLMAGGITKHDNHYELEDPIVEKAIVFAKKNGYEIGLHPSFAAYRRADLFTKEKNKLEQICGYEVRYSRQHFLHFSFPETAEILEQNRMSNDSTMGYQDRIGFRCGTGFEYFMYNFKEERAWNFTQTPMVVMDCALLQQCKNQVQPFLLQFWAFLQKNQKNTFITFNFHNYTFDKTIFPEQELKSLYQKLPTYFSNYSTNKNKASL